jgi:glycosyltransferase involved in cell wall biosynthesis
VVGGWPQQAHLLNRTLQELGVTVTVVTARLKGSRKFELLDNVPIHRLWTLPGLEGSYRWRVFPWLLPLAAFLIVHRYEYDLIHIHQALHPAAISVLIGKLLRKPTLIRVTGSGASGNIAFLKKRWWFGAPVRWVIPHTDCLVSLSEDITSELVGEGISPDRIVRIGNGIDTTLFSPSSLQFGTADAKTVLGVGRQTEEKGFDILVIAWAKVVDRFPDAQLIIVGDGPGLPALTTMVRELGIERSVCLEGRRDNVIEYLARAHLFVLPSRNEGMSNALLEAMSMGRACLASDIPANRAVLTPGKDGLMFRKEDPDDLAMQIMELFGHPHLMARLGREARETITSRFGIGEKARMYADLYSRLFAGEAPAVSPAET